MRSASLLSRLLSSHARLWRLPHRRLRRMPRGAAAVEEDRAADEGTAGAAAAAAAAWLLVAAAAAAADVAPLLVLGLLLLLLMCTSVSLHTDIAGGRERKREEVMKSEGLGFWFGLVLFSLPLRHSVVVCLSVCLPLPTAPLVHCHCRVDCCDPTPLLQSPPTATTAAAATTSTTATALPLIAAVCVSLSPLLLAAS